MKRKPSISLFIVVFFLLYSMGTSTAASESTGNLIVNISGFPTSEGFAMVALHDSESSYQGGEATAIAKTRIKVVNQKARVVFADLGSGGYGVSVYHDENANGKLDKNAMGIPKEAFGFSNNAKGLFGKPGYGDVQFQINSAETEISIKLN